MDISGSSSFAPQKQRLFRGVKGVTKTPLTLFVNMPVFNPLKDFSIRFSGKPHEQHGI